MILNLNWDFVLYFGGSRTEGFLSDLLTHVCTVKTTYEKVGKMTFAAPSRHPGICMSP